MSLYQRPNLDPDRPAIICCALSGVVADRRQCPAIPYTPEEYASEARRAYEAGASMVHIHARTPDGTPSFEVEDYRNIREAILAEVPIVINFSTGAMGVSVEKRLDYIRALKPAVGALNMGTMNYAKYSERRKSFVFDFVFSNPISEIIAFIKGFQEVGTRPEMECFDAGHVGTLAPLIDMGLLTPPYEVSLIMGVTGGIPGTVECLVSQVALLPPGTEWQLVSLSLDQWRLLAAAAAMGGNVRVGLEDNFYLAPGQMARSNGDLVAKAARMITDQGRRVATADECRARLGLVHP